jgi:Protein of unknown function DUF262/Protein of unknown function (DUF1524)
MSQINSPSDTRAKSVSDVFKASPLSVFEFFAKAGQGLYVPAYQRPYSWDKSNISRLVEDVSHGFKMLVSQPDTVTFLGTIIAIHDTQHKTVSPLVRGKVPSRVMTIIDGQQRLTTLLIISIALHEQLRIAGKKLKSDSEADNWLGQEIQRQLAELQKTFEEDQAYGHAGFRYYPRMIRSFDDQWSTDQQAQYKSPLAWYLHKYGEHLRATEALGKAVKKFTLTFPPFSGNDDVQLKNAHEAFQDRVKSVHKSLRGLDNTLEHDDDGMEIPKWSDVIANKPFQQALLNQTEFPECVCELLKSDETDFHRVLRALLFSRFLLTRVGLTVVEATNEDSAFDLFEALNTTGEPLTAYETFKPKVIQNVTLANFLQSENHKHLKSIDEYLSQFTKTDEKQEATRNLVVTFALAETGEKLSRHLSEQRRFLRDRFEALTDSDRVGFLRHFSCVASFYKLAWPPATADRPSFGDFDSLISDTARICIDYLRQSGHTITIAPLARFFDKALQAKESNETQHQKQAARNLEDAIKAVAAFWTLWRSSRAGTDSIDSHYRALMQFPQSSTDISGAKDEDFSQRYLALARHPKGTTNEVEPSIASLKTALLRILKDFGKIETKDIWAEKVIAQSAYKANAVTRFLLLTALHDSPADISNPGLNEKGTPGSVNIMTFDTWRSLSTLEHIAPQKVDRNSDWPKEIYADQPIELVDTLGNLTVLPHSINASVSNRSWKSKRYLYQVLSSSSEQAMQTLLSNAHEYSVSQPTQQLLNSKSTYMAQVDALGKVEGDWSKDLIISRGKRLSELCWDRLHAWLE